MKRTAWGQMCDALRGKKDRPVKRRTKSDWSGSLSEVAAYGRKGLRKMQEVKNG